MILDNTGEKPAAWRGRMAILLIVLAGASAYLNSFPGVFLFDGAQGLFDGPTPDQGAVWDTTVDGRQPLVRISLAINHTISGFAVWSYHAFNIAVHILAGLILFGVVGRTLSAATNRAPEGRSASWLALIVALIWVVHPLQTASVTCIAYRGEVMTGAFYLLTVYALVRGACAAQPMGWYGLSVLCCAAGMGCSLTMITAPVVAVLYDRAFLSRSFRELWGRRLGLYAGLAATWGVPAALGNVPGAISLDYALAQPSVILHYLRLCFWPQGLCLDYGGPVATTALAAPAILLLVAGSLWAWRSRRWLGFAGTCFFLLLAPTSSSIPTEQPVSEQRMYLPLTAVIVVVVVAVRRLLGSGLHRVAQKRPRVRAGAGGILAGLAIAALGYASVERNQDYQSALTMWADVLEQRPQNLRAHHQLSVEHRRLGNLDQAAAHARAALKAQPDDATAHHDLALALRGQGMIDEAITHYRHALEQRPTWAEAYHNLGLGLFDRGAFEESISSLQQSLRLQPNRSESHCQLAKALVADNRLDEAAEHCGEAIRKAPSYAEAHNTLGMIRRTQGDLEDAVGHYRRALELEPDYARAHNNLGMAFRSQGKPEDAILCYRRALEIDADFAEAHSNLGNVLLSQDRPDEAIHHHREALRLQPQLAQVHYNLGSALFTRGDVGEATTHFAEAALLKPDFAGAHYNLATALTVQGRGHEAVQPLKNAVRLRPDWPDPLRSLAWIRATHPRERVRNGGEAVMLAERAAQLTQLRDPRVLDALAAAYAEAGRFAEAVSAAQRARALSASTGQVQLARNIDARLELYLRDVPFRQTESTGEKRPPSP